MREKREGGMEREREVERGERCTRGNRETEREREEGKGEGEGEIETFTTRCAIVSFIVDPVFRPFFLSDCIMY
jgi:hypothetical protein